MNAVAAAVPDSLLVEIPSGAAGVRATLKWMGHLVKRGKINPTIRNFTAQLVANLPQKDYIGEIRAVFDFVQNKIRYVRDIRNVETIHFAEQVLAQGWGDCDDKAILVASMLEAIGKPTRFVAVGFKPGELSHVFVDVAIAPRANRWLTLETTEPQPMGWRPPGIVQILPWYN